MMRKYLQYITLFSVVFFRYCATGEEFVRSDVNFQKYQRIAVFPLTDYYSSPGSGIQVADIVSFEMLKRGLKIVDRANTETILREQKIGISGIVDEKTAPNVGKLLGVQAILTGSINEYTTTEVDVAFKGPPSYLTISAVGLTLKLIDTETGEVVWSATGRATQVGDRMYSICAQNAVKKMLVQLSNHLK
ncbi:MAG: CsgG/HfaB family protein [bacterium]